MSHFHGNSLLGASGSQGYEIGHSLRFDDDSTAYLNFTPGSAGNQKTWTWSAWIKRSGSLGSYQHIFNPVNGGDGVNEATLRFDNSDRLQVYDSGTTRGNLVTTQVFRDVSAWYHIVVALDTTQATASNRLKIYVNGQQVTAFATETYPSQDTTWGWNGTQRHDLGRYAYGSSLYFDGYIAETHFVDGTQLAPSNFGETNPVTGAWIPKQYSGSHGSQGWYLDFSDNSGVTATTLGKDSSGNGNNWTPNNFSVTAGTGNDSLEDTPTNNWCTLNPLNRGVDNPTVGNGNLYLSSPSTDHTVVATFAIPSSGRWYWEYSKTAGANLMSGIIYDPEVVIGSGLSTYLGGQVNGYSVYATNGQKYTGAIGNQTYMATPPTSTTITVAFDADNNELYFGADGNWGDGAGNTDQAFATAAVAYTVPTGKTYYPAISFNGGNAFANFGQRPFDHTPPTGYKALNAANLPVPTIKNGTEYFNTVLYTGTGSSNAITGVGFQPSLTWIKKRSASENHELQDAVRGATKRLASNTTDIETTVAGSISSFDSDGFTVVDAGTTNENTFTYVAWNWKAGGSGSANSVGTISSTVSVNADAGFSIVKYTGDGTDAGSSTVTVGHSLGKKPEFIITKKITSGTDYGWSCWHKDLGAGYGIWLHLTNARNPAMWDGDSNHSSTVFSPADSAYNNVSSSDYINYLFTSVEGYSKFGTYEGNTSPNGPYVFTGFSVAWLMVKNIDHTGTNSDWVIHDNKRNPHNVADNHLEANTANAENGDGRPIDVDFLSNGFKIKTNGSYYENNNTNTYIYIAFAKTPFKYANAR